MDDVEDFLEHVGVKGMRWGTRRSARLNSKAVKTQAKADRSPTLHTTRKADRAQSRSDRRAIRTPEGRSAVATRRSIENGTGFTRELRRTQAQRAVQVSNQRTAAVGAVIVGAYAVTVAHLNRIGFEGF